MTKEDAYDSLINPLMAQIIAICKEHEIPMLASFALDEEDLHCTTALLQDEWGPSEALLAAYRAIYGTRSPLMITTRNADGEITRMDAIL